MRVRNPLPILASLLVIASVLQLGAAPVAGETDDVVDVDVGNFFFDPDSVTLAVGDSIHWIWVGGTHGIETSDGAEEWCEIQSSGTCDKVFDTVGTFDYRCTVHPTSMTATVTVESPAPTVTVLTPAPGAELDGSITFAGTALHSSGIASVDVRVDDGPYAPATLDGDDWSASIDTTAYINGPHTLTARATSNEDSEGNASVSVTFLNVATYDLRVDAVEGTTGILGPATITATIGNGGNTAVADAVVRFSHIDGEKLVTLGEVTTDVPAGDAIDVSFEWSDPFRIGEFDVRVDVDPQDAVPETNEFNNDDVGTAAFWTDLVPGTAIGP